ncbi:MAG: hypothetical protein H7067_01285 [Burkholderiales bacterium]|nr:hypothetical protein [Opitutaceae bacterium]
MSFPLIFRFALLSVATLLATGVRAAHPRIFASSNQSLAQGLTASGANSIRESRKVVYFNEDLVDLTLGYANYYIGTTGENNTGQGNVNVKFALEYQGQFYPFLINGQRLAPCADGTTLSTDALPVVIHAGTYGAIRMWEQKVTPDSTSNSWLWSTDGDTAFNEGSITHNDPARDWTLGGAPGENAAVSWTVNAAGVITPTITNAGSGITTSAAVITVLDTRRAGTGFSYIATVSGGKLATWYSQNGGSGYSQDVWVGPSGMGGYGAGGLTQTHGPCVIAGTPVAARKSVLILGDSIAAGYGSTDGRGDIWRNFGIYARSLTKLYNVNNASKPGLTAYACDYRYTRTRELIKSILNPQVVLLALGTNDIDQGINDSGSKTVPNALKGHLASIASWWQTNCGSEIWLSTMLPRVTIASGVQTVKPGFEAGGNADQVNTALRANTVIPASTALIDGRALVQNPASPAIWRTDAGNLTTDGTHPNDALGNYWISSRLVVPIPDNTPVPPVIPAAPAGLAASAGNNQVALTWNAVSGAASYTVKRATTPGGPYATVVATGISTTGYTDATVTNGTTYHYVVSAVNTAGESPASAAVSATPQLVTVVILDNTDATGVAITGSWSAGSGVAGYYGSNYIFASAGTNGTVRYTPTLPTAGLYEVHARWTTNPNRATNSPYDIVSAGGPTTTVVTNQQLDNGVWVSLGTYTFNAGTAGYVLLRCTGADGVVVADAVRFTLKVLPTVGVAATVPAGQEYGSIPAVFTISRQGAGNTAALAVNYTLSGTAAAGVDYTGASGTLTIPAGADSATVTITPVADALAEGDETIVLTLTANGAYQLGAAASAQLVLQDRPLDAWRFAAFGAGQLANPAISGNLADPDGDDHCNLLEYALGSEVLSADVTPLAVAVVDNHLALTFRRRLGATDITYTPEVGSDLSGWTSGPSVIEETIVEASGDGFETIRARDLTALGATPRRFMRLRVTAP